MNKKIFISLILAICVIFSFTFCLANNEDGLGKAANDVKNFVGGVEDKVENGARDISNTSKDATGSFENSMNGNDNRRTNNGQTSMGLTNDNNGRYTATRTGTGTDNTVMGMSSTAWTWLIVGIAAIAIIAIIWYYSMRMTNNDNNND